MPIYLLLDNNALYGLVGNSSYSTSLSQLKDWINNNEVTLLVTRQTEDEWKKHRPKIEGHALARKRDYEKGLKAFYATNGVNTDDVPISHEDQNLFNQCEDIDGLISNGIKVEEDPAVTHLVYNLGKDKVAPFFNKDESGNNKESNKESSNDAYLFLFTKCFIEKNNLGRFYFLSNNHKDFSDPTDLESLHPMLKTYFPGGEVVYVTDKAKLFEMLRQEGLSTLPMAVPNRQELKVIFPIDRKLHVLDQVHIYHQMVFKEWSFLPLRFFAHHYPYITNNRSDYYNEPFTLHTDNEVLYQLLSHIANINGELQLTEPKLAEGVENVQEKVRQLARCLAHNQIRYIQFKDGEPIPFFNSRARTFGPEIGMLVENEINSFFDLSALPDDNAFRLLQKAQFLSHLGSFKEAADMLFLVADKATNENIHYYLAHYNLIFVKNYLYPYYYDDGNLYADLKERINKIDIEETFRECSKVPNSEVLRWVHRNLYMSDAILTISNNVANIRDSYHSRSRGNSLDTKIMLYTYQQLVKFVTFNNIFSEDNYGLHTVSNLFAEGCLASLACREDLGGKLTFVSDDTLFPICRFVDSRILSGLFVRYGIKKINYHTNDSGQFTASFIRFLQQHGETLQKFESQQYIKTDFLWERYQRLFCNYLILTGYLEMPDIEVENTAWALLEVLKGQHRLRPYDLILFLRIYFDLKGHQISGDLLKSFMSLIFLDRRYTGAALLYVLSEKIIAKGENTAIESGNFFEQLALQYLQPEALINSQHLIANIVYYFPLASSAQKITISNAIRTALENRFDPSGYNHMVISDVIKENELLKVKYNEYIKQRLLPISYNPKGINVGRVQMKSFYQDPVIDQYINYLFKFEMEPEPEIAKSIRGLSSYYEWLLELDDYHYQDFNLEWVTNYLTIHYKRKFNKSQALRDNLARYAKNHPKSDAGNLFVQIFG